MTHGRNPTTQVLPGLHIDQIWNLAVSFQGLQSGGIQLQEAVQYAALITAQCYFLQVPSLTAPASRKVRIYPARQGWLFPSVQKRKIH